MSQFNKSKDVELGSIVIDGINLTTYKAKVKDLLLKAKTWSPTEFKNPDRYYFGRFEYQSDGKVFYDGKYIPSNAEKKFDKKNAIVGCGIDFSELTPFFVLPDGTKRYLPASIRADPFVSLIPFVTLNNKGESMAVNFGERKFAYDPFEESSTAPTHFVRQKDLKYDVEGYTISVNSDDKINYRSIQANRKFNRSDPTTIPYYEIKIIKADAHVMLGFSDFFFDSYNAIGKMGNAVGWVDPKQICFTTPTNQVEPLVQKTGDIFGCGIMMDSYNTNRIFITKNGKWIGFITDLFMRKVHDGMDCFPTISFLGSATVSYNFGASKFSWDAKNAPMFQRTNGINAVPAEVLSIILEYASSHSEAFALKNVMSINKRCQQVMLQLDPVWRRLYYNKFPNQTPDLKVKNWYKFFTRRASVMKTVSDPHPIENCSLVFECPMILENFKNLKDGDKQVFCDKCQKDVHIVETVGQLQQHALLGHCVAWKVNNDGDEFMMGGAYYDDDF